MGEGRYRLGNEMMDVTGRGRRRECVDWSGSE